MTYTYNLSDQTVPNTNRVSMTTNFSQHKIGSNMTNNTYSYLKYYLNVSGSQDPGTYNNNITLKAVPNDYTP